MTNDFIEKKVAEHSEKIADVFRFDYAAEVNWLTKTLDEAIDEGRRLEREGFLGKIVNVTWDSRSDDYNEGFFAGIKAITSIITNPQIKD